MENRNIKLLAMDLDGTLTNSKKELSPGNHRALDAARERGVVLALASGRPQLGIRKLAEKLELAQKGGFILAYNGGEILDCGTGKIIFRHAIPMELVPKICEAGRELGLHLINYDQTHIYCERPDGTYVQRESFCCGTEVLKADRLEDVIREAPPKFIAADEPELLQHVRPILEERFGQWLDIGFSERYFMEITAKGVDKALGLSRIADYLGITRDEIMALGDGFNDISMLKYAGCSVAMGNAFDEVKAVAKDVTAGNDEDGVALAVEKYILGNN